MTRFKVIISIVTWNSAEDIQSCLSSVLSTNHMDYRIIVFDNDSNDSTIIKLRQFNNEKITIIENNSNIGFAAGHNYVINNYNADYYLILNPDAEITPTYISEGLKAFKKDNRIGAVAGILFNNSQLIDCAGMNFEKDRRFILNGHLQKQNEVNLESKYVDGVDGAVALYSAKMIQDVSILEEFFDESYFAYGEDWDVAWRMKILGWKCYLQNTCHAKHSRKFKQGSLAGRKRMSKKLRMYSVRNSLFSIIKNESSKFNLSIELMLRFARIFGYSVIFEQYNFYALWEVKRNWVTLIKWRTIIMNKSNSRYLG